MDENGSKYNNYSNYDNYNYRSYSRPPKKRGIFSYVLVAIISAIIGGIVSSYIAPTYLYGKILPMPEIFQGMGHSARPINEITITPSDDYNAVTAVAKKNMSSVVGITTVVINREWIWERPQEGVGSGVIVDSRGYILTNSHVIGDGRARSIHVLFEDGETVEGEVLWYDSLLDLAVVKAPGSDLPVAELGNSDDLEVGELAVAIGNPLGLDFQRSVTSGVISGLHRSIRIDQYNVIEDLIQTDASINPGNSGGPLLNSEGQVIGINTAKIQTGEGLGFSIPINLVKPIIEEVILDGEFTNVYIGFNGEQVEIFERRVGMDLDVENGVIVREVIPESAAAEAGLKALDVVVEMDGTPIDSMAGLRKLLYNYRLGDHASLVVIRDGEELNVEITFKSF
ncbi:MAG TPA: trypsin-like peptidase domain-containing protein [Tissierellaceae bacterium]|nr:trypsin-like peptidase domain-containing protein [Tissierellaceae bacterium]